MFKCDKCHGTSTTSHLCENPCCPNMPCCGKSETECSCYPKTFSISIARIWLFNNKKVSHTSFEEGFSIALEAKPNNNEFFPDYFILDSKGGLTYWEDYWNVRKMELHQTGWYLID